MQFSSLFAPSTIRHRLILLSGITASLIIALISMYSYQFVTFENKLTTLKRFDDLFREVLELRRYEKDILLQLGEEYATKARLSLQKIEGDLDEIEPEITRYMGPDSYRELHEIFVGYRTTFNSWCTIEGCATVTEQDEGSDLIRSRGQELVSTTAELVRRKRSNISRDFKDILFWFTFIPAVVFVCAGFLVFSQTRRILTRLSSLRKATKDLAAGEFKVIETTDMSSDEISRLINNFNQMVVALKQKQEELIQSKKMASIGTFSSGIAHEINNPLNNISLSADTLIEEFDSMKEEEVLEILDDIMIQTERASKIVRNLLDFSRIQSAEMQPLDIRLILHKTAELIANELRIHKIVLNKDIADQLPLINGDMQKLQQVFLNLIINAEQAIGEYGTITMKAWVTDKGFIRTDICDNGPGISQENLDQIFDPFFTTREAGKGTGLGLAIVYGIVKEHGGYIEVASTLGEGTSFSVYLPLYREQKQIEGVES